MAKKAKKPAETGVRRSATARTGKVAGKAQGAAKKVTKRPAGVAKTAPGVAPKRPASLATAAPGRPTARKAPAAAPRRKPAAGAGLSELLAHLEPVAAPPSSQFRALKQALGAVEARPEGYQLLLDTNALLALRHVVDLAGDGPLLRFLDDNDFGGGGTEVTSQEAADLLNVSRPFVVKLAREGVLKHRKVGNRHRFALADVLEFEARQAAVREEALAALVPEAGYSDQDF